MRLRPKFFVYMLIFTGVILLLIQPSILVAIQNLTPKQAYAPNSLVITIPPEASESDLHYCFLGQKNISVSVIFYNTNGNPSWMNVAISEFARANITLTMVYHWKNESNNNFYDYEYESMLSDFRALDGTKIVVSFTDLTPQPADTYMHLAGLSRVQRGLSIIFEHNLNGHIDWSGYIATHELAHNLGVIKHSTNSQSLMYAVYSGNNVAFDGNDLALLKSLH